MKWSTQWVFPTLLRCNPRLFPPEGSMRPPICTAFIQTCLLERHMQLQAVIGVMSIVKVSNQIMGSVWIKHHLLTRKKESIPVMIIKDNCPRADLSPTSTHDWSWDEAALHSVPGTMMARQHYVWSAVEWLCVTAEIQKIEWICDAVWHGKRMT